VTKVRLCRLSGKLATDRCRLPVIEPPHFDETSGVLAVSAAIREGGIYEDLRHVTRMHESCDLPHTEGGYHQATTVDAAGDAATSIDGEGTAIMRAPAVVPASMRRPGPTPVMTLDPHEPAPRLVSRPSGR
jgi:hypothetical protein